MKLLLSLLLLFACSSIAQPASVPEQQDNDVFLRQYNEKRARNPEGLLFTVRIKDKQKQFHLGEVITLELSFVSSKPETFTLDAATYDRSGRLHSDGFALDQRDNAVDPLADYFGSGLHSFMSGGIRGIPDLTDKPHVIAVELNEWQRIDKPGHYRMYVVSSRVGRKGGGGFFVYNGSSPVVSDVVEFDILPADKKWSKQKLTEIISALAKPGGNHSSACTALRYLGTPEAVTEIRKRFRGDDDRCEWESTFGLIGSPHREFVIRDMESAITLREQPITAHYINTLALLEFSKQAAPAPPYPANEEQVTQWRAEMDRRQAIYDDLRLQHLRQLVLAIPRKQGQARATSLQTLLDYRSELNTGDLSQWPTLLASLPEVFNRLPLSSQLRLLEYRWRPIAGPAMLPVLREVFNYSYKKTKPTTQSEDVENFWNEFQQDELRSIALRRLYELSPEEGRRLILKEMRRPEPRVSKDVLRSLPDETLPELNAVLLSNLQAAYPNGNRYTDIIVQSIQRYATDEILTQVQAVYAAGKLDCGAQAALLAYFLRVAPAVGSEHLKKAMDASQRVFPHCYRQTLSNVAALQMSDEVEEFATAALDDEDADVVTQAASVLGDYGSVAAEKALWRRFEKLHDEVNSQTKEPSSAQEDVEKALRQALSSAQAWLSDPEKLRRLRDLCFTEKSREEVDRMISGWDNQIYLEATPFGDGARMFVANYQTDSLASLKEKLLQFPKGTIFKWKFAGVRGGESREEEFFAPINAHLEAHGMSLKRE